MLGAVCMRFRRALRRGDRRRGSERNGGRTASGPHGGANLDRRGVRLARRHAHLGGRERHRRQLPPARRHLGRVLDGTGPALRLRFGLDDGVGQQRAVRTLGGRQHFQAARRQGAESHRVVPFGGRDGRARKGCMAAGCPAGRPAPAGRGRRARRCDGAGRRRPDGRRPL